MEYIPYEMINIIIEKLTLVDLYSICLTNVCMNINYYDYYWRKMFIYKYGNKINYWNGSWKFLYKNIRHHNDLDIFDSFKSLIKKKRGHKKIQCRNSYQRRLVHMISEHLGFFHKTIFDYTNIHINKKDGHEYKCQCCNESKYECTLTATPFSYVEVSIPSYFLYDDMCTKLIIGSETLLPEPLKVILCKSDVQYFKRSHVNNH